MFSGIVETQSQVLETRQDGSLIRIDVERPVAFDDIRIGDSICTNGVCLTIEHFDAKKMTFALGAETLGITGWNEKSLQNTFVNLERSLRMGDRIHGHLVTGHVDATAIVARIEDLGGSTQIDFRVPSHLLPFIWRKGSWAVNGVSLTVNSVEDGLISVCLIPETLKRTNLGVLSVGAKVNIEVDMMARGLIQYFESANSGRP